MWRDKIRAGIEARGWRQANLARAIGETDDRVSKWLSGTGWPKPQDMARIAEELGLDCGYLCDDRRTDPRGAHGLTTAQEMVLALVRVLGEDEALRRLAQAEGEARPRIPAGPARTVEGETKARR